MCAVLCIYLYIWLLFILIWSVLIILIWRTPFIISCGKSLQMMNSVGFYLGVFYLLLCCLKDSYAGYRICGWKFLWRKICAVFSIWVCHPAAFVYLWFPRKNDLFSYWGFLIMWWIASLADFEISSLSLVFGIWILMCLSTSLNLSYLELIGFLGSVD